LHNARPDVEAENFRRLAEERHIKRLSPCWLCSIGRPPSGGPVISHLLHSGSYGPLAPRPWNVPCQTLGASDPEFRSRTPSCDLQAVRGSRSLLIGPALHRDESAFESVLYEAKNHVAVYNVQFACALALHVRGGSRIELVHDGGAVAGLIAVASEPN